MNTNKIKLKKDKIEIYLFLDFDGVLHPLKKDDFCCLPILKQFMKENEEYFDFKIVVSSDWQLSFSKNELEKLLDLKIDTTIKDETGNNVYFYNSRSQTILNYIKRHKLRCDHCFIFDDNLNLFPEKELFLLEEINYEKFLERLEYLKKHFEESYIELYEKENDEYENELKQLFTQLILIDENKGLTLNNLKYLNEKLMTLKN